MVTGYPGRTNRHRLPTEVDFAFGWQQPTQARLMGEAIDLIKAETAGRRDGEIKMASRMQGLQNFYKNRNGQQASYEGSDILARKTASFEQLKAWVNGSPERKAKYGADIIRYWVASVDYANDVPCSENLLKRFGENYRKP